LPFKYFCWNFPLKEEKGLVKCALEAGPFSCDPQILLETLLINIRNEVASHQAFMGLKMSEKLIWLQKELSTLKENVELNAIQILDLEKKT
jgi:hypothetical protein